MPNKYYHGYAGSGETCGSVFHMNKYIKNQHIFCLFQAITLVVIITTSLGQCWTDVVDGGPALTQHCFNVSCLLGA